MIDRGWLSPPNRLPRWGVDTLLGVSVFAVLSVVISANQGGSHGPDAIAYLWAAGLGALMLARRHYPLVVLAVTVLGLFAYYAAGYPAVGIAVPVAAALFSAAQFGRLFWAILTSVLVLAVSLFFRLAEGQDVSYVVGYELAGHVLLMGGAIALGDSVRSRAAAAESARRIADLTQQQYRQESDARMRAQRLELARDLHDSIAHTTSVISLHADVARESLERDPQAALRAVTLIKDTASHTMRELRRTVAWLRTSDDDARLVLSLASVDWLVRTSRDAGYIVNVNIDVGELRREVDAAAFRIVQEAVANAMKHSSGSTIDIAAYTRDTRLFVTVTNDGADSAVGRGHGITGMRERADALNGTLSAERSGSDFVVQAVIPLGTS